jgi:hypothetical protein
MIHNQYDSKKQYQDLKDDKMVFINPTLLCEELK